MTAPQPETGRQPETEPTSPAIVVVPGLEEPLVATKPTTKVEDRALNEATTKFQEIGAAHLGEAEMLAPFERFVGNYPNSGWSVAVYTNLGIAYYHLGYFSRAFDAWNAAWRTGKEVRDPTAKTLVDRAAGELARMHARVGHADELTALFKEFGDRKFTGPATELISGSRQGAWEMRNRPGDAFLCGPSALASVLTVLGASSSATEVVSRATSGTHGFTLREVSDLASSSGLPHRLIYREPGQQIPVPSVINWKVSHYAAVVSESHGQFHIVDPTFGGDLLVSRAAIDAEASGYFLVPLGTAEDAKWRDTTSAEADSVYGMGYVSTTDQNATSADDVMIGDSDNCGFGMCVPSAHVMNVSLNLKDTPVGYAPQKGPPVYVRLTFNQRDATQPSNFSYFNVGPKWTLNVLSYILEDTPTGALQGVGVHRYLPGGGSRDYSGYNISLGTFSTIELQTGAQLVRSPGSNYPPTSYTLMQADGGRLVYGKSDGGTLGRRLFLTEIKDPGGNALSWRMTVRCV